MGTRCLIEVEGANFARLYKHWDGYATATLPWLEKFNAEFSAARGDDPQYKFAQLVRSSALMAEEFKLNDSTVTGWGIVPYGNPNGAQYIYTLKADGSVVFKEVD